MRKYVVRLLLQRWSGGEGAHPPGHWQRPHAAAGSVATLHSVSDWTQWSWVYCGFRHLFLVLHHGPFIDLWFTSTSIQAKLSEGSLFLRRVWGHLTVKIKTLCPDFNALSQLPRQHNKHKALVICLAQGSSVMTPSRTAADSVPSLFLWGHDQFNLL